MFYIKGALKFKWPTPVFKVWSWLERNPFNFNFLYSIKLLNNQYLKRICNNPSLITHTESAMESWNHQCQSASNFYFELLWLTAALVDIAEKNESHTMLSTWRISPFYWKTEVWTNYQALPSTILCLLLIQILSDYILALHTYSITVSDNLTEGLRSRNSHLYMWLILFQGWFVLQDLI